MTLWPLLYMFSRRGSDARFCSGSVIIFHAALALKQ
jgi:hypothetical protein